MFAYCGNSPISRTDPNGAFWKELGEGLSGAWKQFMHRMNAIFSSIEFECGLGTGVGFSSEKSGVVATQYHDFSIGLDDGKAVTGNLLARELSVQTLGIGDTYMHPSNTGHEVHTCKETSPYMTHDGVKQCTESQRQADFSSGFFTISSSGDILIGSSDSYHCIFGGHYSLYFNLTEYFERAYNYEQEE